MHLYWYVAKWDACFVILLYAALYYLAVSHLIPPLGNYSVWESINLA